MGSDKFADDFLFYKALSAAAMSKVNYPGVATDWKNRITTLLQQ